MALLLDVPGLRRAGYRFMVQLVRVMERAEADPSLVAAVISFETSATFSPSIRNPYSGAVGLIQWTESGARAQGYSKAQIARMGRESQLALVGKWYASRSGKLSWRPVDYYLAIFAPAAVGKPLGATVYAAPSLAYEQNKGLDGDGDGRISVQDVSRAFMGLVNEAERKPRIEVNASRWVDVAAISAALALGGLGYYLGKRGVDR